MTEPSAQKKLPLPASAGVILIGDELLTGKIDDANGSLAIQRLRRAGIRLGELAFIGDAVDRIADCVREFSARFEFVITSGGIGPTHDDLTMLGVAGAFNLPLQEDADLANRIRTRFGETKKGDVWMRMAQVPEGTTFVETSRGIWPVFVVKNVHVLPGVPQIFEHQLDTLMARFEPRPVSMLTLYVNAGEGDLAPTLTAASEAFAEVAIGSYPVLQSEGYRTRVTFESLDPSRVAHASQWVRERLPEGTLQSVEDGSLRLK